MSRTIAVITLPFWALFALDLYFDFYLQHPLLGMCLKFLFPIVVLANVAGVVVGIVHAAQTKKRRLRPVVGIVLNSLPLLMIASVVYWWVFLFRI